MKKVFFLLLATTIFNLGAVSASYISGSIYIYSNGDAKFSVNTDVPINLESLTFENNKITGTTSQLVSLSGGVWTFSLELNNYDDIFLDVHLPNNLDSITTISGPDSIIDVENKIVTIIDSGNLDFLISYRLREVKENTWIIWSALTILVVIAYFVIIRLRKRKQKIQNALPFIGDCEQKILDLLIRSPKRQKELRKSLGIPKASFSRYMVNLEKKKLIIREGEGKNKIVKLK